MNVQVARALMLVLSVVLTPAMSPQRLAANSQFQMVLRQPIESTEARSVGNSPFRYLRFETGTYGHEKLLQLAALQNNPGAERIRRIAAATLAQEHEWQGPAITTPEEIRESLANVSVYPQGRILDAALMEAVVADLLRGASGLPAIPRSRDNSVGVFVDLNDDNSDEFVLLQQYGGTAFENHNGIVFTTNGWLSSAVAFGHFDHTLKSGDKVWRMDAPVGGTNRVDYAIFYRVNGQEFWDNNFWRNYALFR